MHETVENLIQVAIGIASNSCYAGSASVPLDILCQDKSLLLRLNQSPLPSVLLVKQLYRNDYQQGNAELSLDNIQVLFRIGFDRTPGWFYPGLFFDEDQPFQEPHYLHIDGAHDDYSYRRGLNLALDATSRSRHNKLSFIHDRH